MLTWRVIEPSQHEKGNFSEIWSGRRVSNSRPQPWQGCALPTELLPHGVTTNIYRCIESSGAGEESRTLDLNLGKVALYQLSYSRMELYFITTYCHDQLQLELEREKSLELSTSTLARLRSTN